MLSYKAIMPNTKSAEKAVRSSQRKRAHNQMWKNRIKAAVKVVKNSISDKINDSKVLSEQLLILQKTVDKASKEKVIHKNRANRLKSKYAHKIAKLVGSTPKAKKEKSTTKTK